MAENVNVPPRWQQALTTWQAYAAIAAFISTVLTALADHLDKLPGALKWWHELPTTAKIVFGAFVLLVGIGLLVSALSRRSMLLRRERFDLQPDNPGHLAGRAEDISRIASFCEACPLVFLLGESGAGKSALVQAGLLPHFLDQGRKPRDGCRLVPIRLDASALDWERGLRVELARSLRTLSADALKMLGVAESPAALPKADEVFSWLERLPEEAPCRLLIILDQMDDYFVAHQARFITIERCVAKPAELFAASPDWKALAELAKARRVSLVLVCRTDSAAPLSALRFEEPKQPVIRRIAEQDVRGLLDQLVDPGDGKQVIADPKFGWEKLRERVLADLSDKEEQFLPGDLAAALRNLRDLRHLDVAAYAAAGGLDGLENRRIQTIVREASAKAGVSSDALFRGLLALTSEDGAKTIVRRVDEFASVVIPAPADGSREADSTKSSVETIGPAIAHLVEERIVRRLVPESGEESLALFHDRLARSIRRAERQANRWVHQLRDGARRWRLAGTWRERLRALLPIGVQARLAWERLRGRMRYGENARFAIASTLPVLAWCCAACAPLCVWLWVEYHTYTAEWGPEGHEPQPEDELVISRRLPFPRFHVATGFSRKDLQGGGVPHDHIKSFRRADQNGCRRGVEPFPESGKEHRRSITFSRKSPQNDSPLFAPCDR
jgi:conflict system STAND superfamily ATPase